MDVWLEFGVGVEECSGKEDEVEVFAVAGELRWKDDLGVLAGASFCSEECGVASVFDAVLEFAVESDGEVARYWVPGYQSESKQQSAVTLLPFG